VKNFAEFLKTEAARQIVDPAFIERINASLVTITTQRELVAFAQARYPDHFHADPRKPTTTPYGRTAMQQLWAAYLAWAEMPEKVAKKG
jgi:hypothetical protein